MNKRDIRLSIKAAQRAIEDIKTTRSVSRDTLKPLSRVLGESLDQYNNKPDALQISSTEQSSLAIEYLRDFIHDRKIELRSKKNK